VSRDGFDRVQAIFTEILLAFVFETQTKEWTSFPAVM